MNGRLTILTADVEFVLPRIGVFKTTVFLLKKFDKGWERVNLLIGAEI